VEHVHVIAPLGEFGEGGLADRVAEVVVDVEVRRHHHHADDGLWA
jgi:hypothetical protein